MKRSRINFTLAFSMVAVIVSVIGTITGTLAWYAYVTRATLSFSGTSAYASERLMVGIHDIYYDDEDSEHEHPKSYLFDNGEFNLAQFAASNDLTLDYTNKIIWGKEGEGLTGSIISTYLQATPYSDSDLPPVTSKSRNATDILTTLYKAPLAMSTEHYAAPKSYYTKIPLCFKVLGSSNDDILSDQDIWLTGVSAIDVDIEGLKDALRIYFENKYAVKKNLSHDEEDHTDYASHRYFLVNPVSDETEVGETVVAGVLDLKGDGTYDYDNSTMKEVMYGDYEGTLSYSDPYVAPESNPLVDINNTGLDVSVASNASTFLAAHTNNVEIPDYSSVALGKAKYDTMSTIAPRTVSGHFQKWSGKPVAHTDDAEGNIAYCDMTIYLEGWDHAIINKVISASFNLGLQFEVDHL